MRSRFLVSLGLILALAVVAIGCSSDDTGEEAVTTTEATTTTTEPRTTTSEPTTTTTAAPEPTELVIWVDEERAAVLDALAPTVLEETGVALEIEQFGFADLPELARQAISAGEGPDIFIGAHFWTGGLAAEGIVAPVDLTGRDDEWADVSRAAFNYNGSLYAVPYATEAIGLYYNSDLVPNPPTTFDELTAICDSLETISNCLGIPGGADDVSQAGYYNYPFVSLFGGYIFGFDPSTGFDTADVGLDSDEAIAGATALETLINGGYVGNVTEVDAKAQFVAGTSPFFLDGPWSLDDLSAAQMSYGVTPLPTAEGSSPGPLVGAHGFFINQHGNDPSAAQAFLLEYVATGSVMTALSSTDTTSPAFLPSLEALPADDVAVAFAGSAAMGQPIPNTPEMSKVWEPLSNQLNELRNGTTDAAAAMQAAAAQVREAVQS